MGYTLPQISGILLKADRTMYKIGKVAYDDMFNSLDEALEYDRDIIYIYKAAVEYGDDFYVGQATLDSIVERLWAKINIYDYGQLNPIYSDATIVNYVLQKGSVLNDLDDVTITNLQDNQILKYSAALGQWVNTGSNAAIRSTQSFTATLNQTVFTTTSPFTAPLLDVYLNGVRLNSASYSTFGNYTITLLDGCLADDIIDVTIYDPQTDILDMIGYMKTSVYDKDNDGIVDNSEKISIIARNSTGATIHKGKIVYLQGSTGNRPNILLAQANSEASSSKTFGVVVADIADNADGEVAAIGTLHDLDTRSNATHPFTTDTLVDGDKIWLSATNPGYVTKTPPTQPNHTVFIGFVARTTPSFGRIIYNIQNGFELNELHNVLIASEANKDILNYDSTTGLWKNATKAGWLGGTASQFVKADGSLDSNTYLTTGDAASNYVALGGSYANPSWITALAWSKITGAPAFLTTETDPIFTAHPAFGITGTKISNWDDAYTWVANFPTQTGNTGKFLTTNGSALSWADVINSNIYTADGTLTGNRTVTMGAYTLSFEKDIIVNGHRIGRGNGNVSTSIAIGQLAATSTTTASQSVFIGYSAGNLVTTANANVLIGAYAGRVIDTGGANTVIGHVSGYTLTSGTYNTLIGRQSGNGLTTGIHNVVVSAIASGTIGITTGSYNTVIGSQVTGLPSTLSNNIILADGQGNIRIRAWDTGNVGIGTTADSGYKLDVNGSWRLGTNFYGVNASNGQVILENTGGETYLLTGKIYFRPAGGQYLGQVSSSGWTFGSSNSNSGNRIWYNYSSNFNNNDDLILVQWGQSHSNGNPVVYTNNLLNINPTLNNATGNSINTFRGIYYNPTLTSLLNTTHIFLQSTSGDVLLGTTSGSVGIGANTSINASAIVDITSTTKGFLPPRMTTTQRDAIASPAIGLVIYNTTTLAPNVYNGTSWGAMGGDNIYTADGMLTGNRVLSYTVAAGGAYENKLTFRNTGVTGGPNDDFIFQASSNSIPILKIWNPNYGGAISFSAGSIGFGGGRMYLSTSGHDITFTPGGVQAVRFFNGTGNVVIQNGGTFVDAGYKLDVQGTGRFTGNLRIGSGASIVFESNDFIYNTSSNGFRFTNSGIGIVQSSAAQSKLLFDGRAVFGSSDPSESTSQVEINSTTKGFLQPRMTTTQRDAISTPATGLQVYNTTTNTNDYYNGTSWVALTTSASDTNIYNSDGTLTGNRTVTNNAYTLTIKNASNTSAALIVQNTQAYGAGGVYTQYAQQWITSSGANAGYVLADIGRLVMSDMVQAQSFYVGGLYGIIDAGTSRGGSIGINGSPIDFGTAVYANGGVNIGRWFATGNLLIQTGGVFADAGYKLDVQGTGRYTGNVLINRLNLQADGKIWYNNIWGERWSINMAGDSSLQFSSTKGSQSIYFTGESTYTSISVSNNVTSSIYIGKFEGREGFIVATQNANTGNYTASTARIGAGYTSGTTQSASNTNGVPLYINAANGGGSGVKSDIIFQTVDGATYGATDTHQLADRVWIQGGTGNVGIGASPNSLYKLDVSGATRFTSTLSGTNLTGVKIVADGNATGSNSYAALDIDLINTNDAFNNKVLSLKHKGVEYVYFRADGPAANGVLRLANGASIDGATSVSAGGMTITSTTLTISAPGGQSGVINNQGTGGLNIQQGGVTALKVFDSTGNVKIQTGGTFTDNGYKLDVQGTGRFTGQVDIIDSSATSGTGLSMFGGSFSIANTGGFRVLNFTNGAITVTGGNPFAISNNARIEIFSTSATSPIRLGNSSANIEITNNSGVDKITLKPSLFRGDTPQYLDIVSNDATVTYGQRSGSIRIFAGEQASTNGYGYISLAYNGSAQRGTVAIGAATTHASALLDVTSTTQGFLPPRMTSTQRTAISSPSVGLIVYQTDATEGTYEYTSTGWRIINAAGGGSGTVTSVDMSVPTGFVVSGNPVTTSGTLALSFASGYSLPTTIKQTNWDDAYTFVTNFPSQTSNNGKYLTTDGSVLSWNTIPVYTLAGLGGVPTTRTLTINGTALDLSADRSWTVSAGAAGTTGQVQYNNAGSLGGASYVNINQGHIELIDAGTLPTPPSTGRVILFSEDHAGKSLPSVLGPSGVDYNLQAALYGNTTYMWLAGTGTTTAINWGTSFTARNNGTSAAQSHPTKASTNAMTSMNRAQFGTGTTATGASGIQTSATVAWMGNAAGLGGFLFFARFGIETLASDVRAFVGLSANNATMAADASTWANTIGLGKDTGDSTWQIITRSASTLTKTNTSITVTQNQILDVYIHSAPNSGVARVHIKDGATGADLYVSGALSTNLPATTTFLYMQAHIQSVTGTSAKNLSLNRMYLETDL